MLDDVALRLGGIIAADYAEKADSRGFYELVGDFVSGDFKGFGLRPLKGLKATLFKACGV